MQTDRETIWQNANIALHTTFLSNTMGGIIAVPPFQACHPAKINRITPEPTKSPMIVADLQCFVLPHSIASSSMKMPDQAHGGEAACETHVERLFLDGGDGEDDVEAAACHA